MRRFYKKATCKHEHRSAMSNSAWCDLNKYCTVLKLHDMCQNRKCNCQKQNIFTPRQFHLEVSVFKNTRKKIIQRISNSLE